MVSSTNFLWLNMHFLRTHYMFQVFFAKVKEDIFFYKKPFLFIQTASKIKYKFLQSLPKCHHWNQIPFIADINCHLQPSRQQVLFSFHIASKQNWFSIQLKSMSNIVIQIFVSKIGIRLSDEYISKPFFLYLHICFH